MSTPTDPNREHPSTYFAQDRTDEKELTRLQVQDEMVTAALGGVLPEQPDPMKFQRVLDVGCGTGHWLIEAAKTYPTMSQLWGVDVCTRVVEYARAQAAAQQVDDRVQFRTMDALRMLEFDTGYFDLVNQRSGAGYLRKWDWPKILQECQRVARPDGVIRITEGNWIVESNSPALSRLFDLLLNAFYQAGNSFTLNSNGVTGELVRLMTQYGVQDVQTRIHSLEQRPGTASWQHFVEDMELLFQTIVPFLHKWTRVPDNYNAIYRQALHEMHQPDFVATGSMLTAWGTKGKPFN